MNSKLIEAHRFHANNKSMLMKDNKCGCFFCLEIFHPTEIKEWVNDTDGTAICPYCGIDSVIGESSGYPISRDFLSEMKQYWF